jgi:hypothetical protein
LIFFAELSFQIVGFGIELFQLAIEGLCPNLELIILAPEGLCFSSFCLEQLRKLLLCFLCLNQLLIEVGNDLFLGIKDFLLLVAFCLQLANSSVALLNFAY